MATHAEALEALVTKVGEDPGLTASIAGWEISAAQDAARAMNGVYDRAIEALGIMGDGKITPAELKAMSDWIRENRPEYRRFIDGHGNDEGSSETGFHLAQGDGGTMTFQGRAFVNTVADAVYHIGFRYEAGRFVNEDGDANERIADVAGWLNYFLTGKNRVFGTDKGETLHSGEYSARLAGAAGEIFEGKGGDDAIWAGDGDDVVFAGTGDDRSGGGTGHDRMYGAAGRDTLSGEAGNDSLFGGSGGDQLSGGEGRDTLNGDAGRDRLWGGEGADVIRGGGGQDTLGGGDGDDRMYGGGKADALWGEAGADLIDGGGGRDRMGGGDGDDTLSGGRGADVISGDAGADILDGGGSADTIYGGAGKDGILGGNGADLIHGGTGRDSIRGQDGADTIHGGEGDDRLWGGMQADRIWGSEGDDLIRGEGGGDTISGDEGADTIDGGRGADTIRLWEDVAQEDVIVFRRGDSGTTMSERDRIEGFVSGTDKIDLSGIRELTWIGREDWSRDGSAEVAAGGGMVVFDYNGDGTIDEMIEVVDVETFRPSDFLF